MTAVATPRRGHAVTHEPREIEAGLAIVGTGIAGFAAAVFAANRGISTAIAGNTGALAYTTGYLDLVGRLDSSAHDAEGRLAVEDPWAALETLRAAEPRHPLALVAAADIRTAFAEFTAFLGERGIGYTPPGDANVVALTPAGTRKPTLCVPATMAAGPRALAAGTHAVIVDFERLKGFSAAEVVANLGARWPGLQARRIAFPDMARGEVYPEVMARALEVPATREKLAALLKEAVGDATTVGLPAILGMYRPDDVHAQLQQLTGLAIFEIPTMPPSVPGIRLRECMEQALPQRGVTLIPQRKVTALELHRDGATLSLADAFGPIRIRAQAVLLATGRFLSGGLEAHPDGIREHLLALPVAQPASREGWYREHYTDPRGHPVSRSGIEVDDTCRPLGRDGRVHHPRLFAAGSVLAHHDWVRSRSGAGIAIATAWRAVEEANGVLSRSSPELTRQGNRVRQAGGQGGGARA